MTVFGAVTGIIALVSLLALLIKYPLRRLGMDRLNAFFMKLHEAASGLFFVAAIAHMLSGLRRLRENPFAVISGLAAFAVSVVLIADCHMAKDVQRKLRRHRIYSALLSAAALCHTAAAGLPQSRSEEK